MTPTIPVITYLMHLQTLGRQKATFTLPRKEANPLLKPARREALARMPKPMS